MYLSLPNKEVVLKVTIATIQYIGEINIVNMVHEPGIWL